MKPPRYHLRFHFPDGSTGDMSLVMQYQQMLEELAGLLTSPELRHLGVPRRDKLAQMLADAEMALADRQKAALARRAQGDRTAERIRKAESRGRDPLNIASERTVRRSRRRRK